MFSLKHVYEFIMSRILKLTEWLGVFPLKFEIETSELRSGTWFWSVFNQIWLSFVAIGFSCAGLFSANNFGEFFYTISDRILLFYAVPVNMLVLWKSRSILQSTWNKSVFIARVLEPSLKFQSNVIAIFICVFMGIAHLGVWLALTMILDLDQWPLLDRLFFGLSLLYSWFQDMVFVVVYMINASVLRLFNQKLMKVSSEKQMKKLKNIYLSLSLNTKKMSSVFACFLISVIVNFFGQIVGCYDFANSELTLGLTNWIVVVTTVVSQLCRVGCLVWVTQQPCCAVC